MAKWFVGLSQQEFNEELKRRKRAKQRGNKVKLRKDFDGGWFELAGALFNGNQRMAQALQAANPGVTRFTRGITLRLPSEQKNPYISHTWMAQARGEYEDGKITQDYWDAVNAYRQGGGVSTTTAQPDVSVDLTPVGAVSGGTTQDAVAPINTVAPTVNPDLAPTASGIASTWQPSATVPWQSPLGPGGSTQYNPFRLMGTQGSLSQMLRGYNLNNYYPVSQPYNMPRGPWTQRQEPVEQNVAAGDWRNLLMNRRFRGRGGQYDARFNPSGSQVRTGAGDVSRTIGLLNVVPGAQTVAPAPSRAYVPDVSNEMRSKETRAGRLVRTRGWGDRTAQEVAKLWLNENPQIWDQLDQDNLNGLSDNQLSVLVHLGLYEFPAGTEPAYIPPTVAEGAYSPSYYGGSGSGRRSSYVPRTYSQAANASSVYMPGANWRI